MTTISIDTNKEAVLIYEVPNAFIFFRQKDVIDILDNQKNQGLYSIKSLKKFRDTLFTLKNKIRIRDLLYSYDDRQRDSIEAIVGINKTEQELNESFYFIGAELLLKGNFMLFSKETKKMVTHNLVAKRIRELMGGAYLAFLMPDRRMFYNVIVSLGD